MGIKNLNRFLQSNCQPAIRQITLWELKGKTIAIDALIYMYRFKADDGLIEGMYQMVSLIQHYGITPLFVFDGKPPPEKEDTLKRRREEKASAERDYNNAQKRLRELKKDENEDTADLEAEIDALRRKFVRIRGEDIAQVKLLLASMGASYYEANGESDGICARLVHKKIAFACLSEDMDMFVYGCGRVLRYLSLLKATVVMYDLKSILKLLGISFSDFKSICILAGTDYSEQSGISYDLNRALKTYSKYSRSNETIDFYDWIELWNKDKIDCQALRSIYDMFSITHVSISEDRLIKSRANRQQMIELLEPYGFVF
jgi:flap endonuclease-1